MKRTVKTVIEQAEFITTSARKARKMNEQDLLLAKKLEKIFNDFNATRSEKQKKFEGFCIGFNIDNKIYAACFKLDTVLNRLKVCNGVDKILQPLGLRQVLNLCEYLCTYEELQDYKARMRGTNATDNGTAFQKYLAYLGKQKVHLDTPLKNGGDLYENEFGLWEVKYMTLGASQGSARLWDKK